MTSYRVQKKGLRHWQAQIDGQIAAAGTSLKQLESQIRIIKMLADMNDGNGTLKSNLSDGA